MAISKIFHELPVNKSGGKIYDVFFTFYTYKPGKDKTIEEHEHTDKYIRGVVKEKHLPKEGGALKMYHHSLTGVQKFGALKLNECKNIVEEDGSYYFECLEGKYLLIPVKIN